MPETLDSLLAKKAALDLLLSGIERGALIFAIIVGIGVAGEAIYSFRAWWNNRKLHTIQESIDHFRQAEIARLTNEGEALKRDTLKTQLAVLPRIFSVDESEHGKKLREERLAEVKKYAGTVALIQPVPDFEAYQLAFHMAAGLRSAGWNVSLIDEAQSHISPGLFWSGVRVVTLEKWPFTPEGVPFSPPPQPSSAALAAMAVVALWDLTLGPPFGPQFFGIHWDREFQEKPLLTARGFTFPPGGVVILVGMRPTEDSIVPTPTSKKE